MEVEDIFKDAIEYPTKDGIKLLIFGVLFLILGIFDILENFGISLDYNIGIQIVGIISGLITIIFSILIDGYGLSITRETINMQEAIPELDWEKNLIDGIKLFILKVVYYLIPFIAILIVAYVTGAFGHLYQILYFIIISGTTTIPQSLFFNLVTNFVGVFLIGAILYIFFSILYLIAIAKFAESDSLAESCNMINVLKKINDIGWKNYINWLIIFLVISLLLGFIMDVIGLIPIFGIIFLFLVFSPFLKMFTSRALGLIYNESK